MADVKPKFDPSKAFEVVSAGGAAKPAFNPNKPFNVAPAIPQAIEGTQAAQGFEYKGVTPKDALNFSTSVGENIPVLGPLAAAGGERFGAVLKMLTDEVQGKDGDYDAALAEIQAMNEAKRRGKMEESPIAVGVAAPLAGAAMLPGPGIGMKGATGAGVRIGGNMALSAADDLARGDAESIPQDVGIVGGIQAAIESAPLIKKTGLSRALKAAFGQQKKAFVATDKAGKLDKTAEAILQADEAGPRVVQFGSTPEDIAPRATAKAEYFGERIRDVGKAIDGVIPQSVGGAEIAAKIRAELDNIPVNAETATVRERLTVLADEYDALGPMSFADAQKHKNSFKYKQTDNTPQVLPQDVRNKVKMAIGDTMDETVAQVAAANGMPDLAEQYARAKEQYGVYKPLAGFAQDRALGDRAVRALSPSDLYVAGSLGTSAFLGSMLSGQDMGSSGGASTTAMIAGAGINNLVRRRGAASAAVTAKFIGDLLETQPNLFGRFKGQLSSAGAKGSTSLMSTHEALLKSPDYQNIMNTLSETFSSQDGDVAVVDNPELIASYRTSIQDRKDLKPSDKAKMLSQVNKDGYYTMDLAPYKQQFEQQAGEKIGQGEMPGSAADPFVRMMGLGSKPI